MRPWDVLEEDGVRFTAVLAMLMSKTGRLPILSESAPRNGLLKNAKNANVENSSVMAKGEAPNDVT